jgi:hypothetical protein
MFNTRHSDTDEQVTRRWNRQAHRPDETVRDSTLNYIQADFKKNGRKYAPDDRDRVVNILVLAGRLRELP